MSRKTMLCTMCQIVHCLLETHLSRLIIDLQSQFSGGSQDERDRVLLTTAIPSILLRIREKIIRTGAMIMHMMMYLCSIYFLSLVPVHCSWQPAEHLLAHQCRSDSTLAARKQQSYRSLRYSREYD